MLFVELRFLFFFLVVFCVHWALQTNRARKIWLLGCSHFFYACFFWGNLGEFFQDAAAGAWNKLPTGWWFPFVLIASTCMDYAVGIGMGNEKSERARKIWLLASVLVNLGVLCFFKYFNFFINSAGDFLHWVGLPAGDWTLRIFLPFGISFYTFQSMSYSIDVYRRRLAPVQSFLDLAFFIAFFPQLVAGPIVRAMTFLPQVLEKRIWSNVDVRACLVLFFIGFVKKACISENVAPLVDDVFAGPTRYNLYATWMGVLFYAVQIYCDFSGYTDMAIATARLLGYELTTNFNFPYFSSSVGEFWRRWHISLSTWLRDYLYISLGGNRGTKAFTYRNLMLTMLLGGLWHGASWNFVFWGGMHGAALIVHREWERLTQDAGVRFKSIMSWVQTPLTFYWICITWVFFRATPVVNEKTKEVEITGFDVARTVLDSFVLFDRQGKKTFSVWCVVLFIMLALIHWLCSRGVFATWWRNIPAWALAALLGIGTALALFLMPAVYKPFIYFQF